MCVSAKHQALPRVLLIAVCLRALQLTTYITRWPLRTISNNYSLLSRCDMTQSFISFLHFTSIQRQREEKGNICYCIERKFLSLRRRERDEGNGWSRIGTYQLASKHFARLCNDICHSRFVFTSIRGFSPRLERRRRRRAREGEKRRTQRFLKKKDALKFLSTNRFSHRLRMCQ